MRYNWIVVANWDAFYGLQRKTAHGISNIVVKILRHICKHITI